MYVHNEEYVRKNGMHRKYLRTVTSTYVRKVTSAQFKLILLDCNHLVVYKEQDRKYLHHMMIDI